jgi:hypothetical protein
MLLKGGLTYIFKPRDTQRKFNRDRDTERKATVNRSDALEKSSIATSLLDDFV